MQISPTKATQNTSRICSHCTLAKEYASHTRPANDTCKYRPFMNNTNSKPRGIFGQWKIRKKVRLQLSNMVYMNLKWVLYLNDTMQNIGLYHRHIMCSFLVQVYHHGQSLLTEWHIVHCNQIGLQHDKMWMQKIIYVHEQG